MTDEDKVDGLVHRVMHVAVVSGDSELGISDAHC